MTIQQIIDEVAELERDITELPAGAPELQSDLGRISLLEAEVEQIRHSQGALVPDASSPPSPAEQSVIELGNALRDLRRAASLKQ
jgi:hypothetical protein